MNEKFNKNVKLEKFTNILGIAVRLIIIDPYFIQLLYPLQCCNEGMIRSLFSLWETNIGMWSWKWFGKSCSLYCAYKVL